MNDPRITSQPAAVKPEPDLGKLGLDMANAIYVAVNGLPNTAYINRTWGDLKRAIEGRLGVRDDDVLSSIEVGVSQFGTGYVAVDRDEFGGIEIREVSRG